MIQMSRTLTGSTRNNGYNHRMATFRRAVTPGATYFFTVNTYQRQALLTDPPVCSALREALRAVKRAHPFTIAPWSCCLTRCGLRIALEPGETEGKPAGQALRP
jgi:putative transposase